MYRSYEYDLVTRGTPGKIVPVSSNTESSCAIDHGMKFHETGKNTARVFF